MRPSDKAPILSAHDLCFGWPQQPLWTSLTLTFPAGVTALVGDESCGKTTLLRLLAGELEPESGTIRILGKDTTGEQRAQRVAWTAPHSDVHDRTVVAAYLDELPRRFPDTDRRLLLDLVHAFSLDGHLSKRFDMLSAGSRRKVWIAAAAASNAPVVLLDQPYAALDGPSIRVVSELLQEAADSHRRAFVVADHEAPEFLSADRVLHLNR